MVIKLLLGVLIGGAIGGVMGYFGKCSSGTCPLTANPFRGALYGAIVGGLLASVLSDRPQEEMTPSVNKQAVSHEGVGSPESAKDSGIIHIDNKADFEAKVLQASGVFLVDLFSNRCPPCRMLAPTIASLAEKYSGKVTVCKVNIDRAPVIAQDYGVMAIPTVLIIKGGKEVKRLVGLRPESAYANELDGLVAK
ncbi:MAG: hypothetical protein JXM79_25020 [Sedimentisphaerales bacterium]|nr:hypothetical protein [Sedimentisphaerales bacterium]